MTPQQWESCLAAARAGSADAIGKLLDGFRPYLWIIAQGELDPRLRAKLNGSDLVQESLLNAYRAFDRFEGDSPEALQAWLRQILRRVLDNQRRQYDAECREAEREVSLEAADSRLRFRTALPDPGETPSQRAMSAEQRQALDRAFELLPPHYREVIRLRSEERQPFEEIARRLGRTPDAARMMWGRAIRKLQALLDVTP
jgi:RNA polymerase sigma-70 factor (ECF subfamily)